MAVSVETTIVTAKKSVILAKVVARVVAVEVTEEAEE